MTLTQAATITRSSIKFSLISLVIIIALFVTYRIWLTNQLANLPPVEEQPDLKYGILQSPELPTSQVSSSNFSYSIDTVDGNLPTFEKLIKVFIMPPTFATLLAGEKSQQLAQKFNLPTTPNIISEKTYEFVGNDAKLSMDLDSGNFIYSKEASKAADLENSQDTPLNETQLTEDFKSFLNSIGMLKTDLKTGLTKVKRINENEKIIEISLWPAGIDQKAILTPNPDKALINATVKGTARNLTSYISLNYLYWAIDTGGFATYPIKSSQTALSDLKSGKGSIIIEPSKPQVSIASITLAYYQSEKYTPYLQPIYVFEGQGFLAYVPAISDEYLEIK